MYKIGVAILLAVTATATFAQPAVSTVRMTNFAFTPSRLELKANASNVLQLRNDSSGGHNFSAPEFFAAARLDPASAQLVRSGRIEVAAHQMVEVRLVPAAGQYPLKCSHLLHSSFGMKGTIVVR